MNTINPSKRLTDLLSQYLEFDEKQLRLGLWGGDLKIEDVNLKKDSFFELLNGWKDECNTKHDILSSLTKDAILSCDTTKKVSSTIDTLDLKLEEGTIGYFRAQVPWKQLLMSYGATVRLDLRDVTVKISLESCVGKAYFNNGGLAELCNKSKDLNISSLKSRSVSAKTRDRKQQIIKIADRRRLDKKDVSSPMEFGKMIEDTKKNPESSNLIKTLFQSFASSLGWRAGQGLYAKVENVQIILVQNGVEAGIINKSIEIVQLEPHHKLSGSDTDRSSNTAGIDDSSTNSDKRNPSFQKAEKTEKSVKVTGLGAFVRQVHGT